MSVKTRSEIIQSLERSAAKMQAVQAAAKIASVAAESEPEPLSPGSGAPLIPGSPIQGQPKR